MTFGLIVDDDRADVSCPPACNTQYPRKTRDVAVVLWPAMDDARTKSDDTVYYRGQIVDVASFRRFHPGGKLLDDYLGEDVSEALKIHKHAKSTYGIIKSGQEGEFDRLVDWSKPLYSQVGALGKKYKTWVHSPVMQPIRIFQSDYLEMMTRTRVHELLLYWIPVSAILLSTSWYQISKTSSGWQSSALQLVAMAGLGVVKWSLLEYFIHRYIFHWDPPDWSPTLITVHFMMHGIHHKAPFDEERLLFPIVPATLIALFVFFLDTLYLPLSTSTAIMSGTVLGYVAYDMIHYFLHYGAPAPGTYFYFMKRYHNQHHFGDTSNGFGISSNVWDRVFSTVLHLRKLSFDLRWR